MASLNGKDIPDAKLSGIVSTAHGAGLALNSNTPVANASVNVYILNTETLEPTLLDKVSGDANGFYEIYFKLDNISTLLVVALDGTTTVGQTIVSVPALTGSEGLKVRSLTGNISIESTIAASLLIAKSVDLEAISADDLEAFIAAVKEKIAGEPSSNVTELVEALAGSSSFMESLAKILDDTGIAETRPGVVSDILSALIPSLPPTGSTLAKIELEASGSSVAKGLSLTIKAYGVYSDDTRVDISTKVIWTSTNTSSATVSKGTIVSVRGTGVGSTSITASYGGKSAQKTITVRSAELVSIDITPTGLTLGRATNKQFIATGLYTDNSTLDITSTATWVSNATSVATVSNTPPTKGIALTDNAGAGSITATVGSISASVTFTVSAATLSAVQVTPASLSLAEGITQNMAATGIFSDTTDQDLTSFATWASDDTAVATVSNASGSKGLVTAVDVGDGNATISATFNGMTGQEVVTVTDAEITEVQLTPASTTLAKGTSTAFTAIGVFTDASHSDITDLATWSTNNAGVATVSTGASPRGVVTAVNVGTTTITATYNGESMTASIVVTAATLVSIAVTPAAPSIPKGSSQQFIATGTYTDATTQVLTSTVTWASATPSVATISNAGGSKGLVTSLTTGVSAISATLNSISGSTSATVSNAELVSIAVTPSTATSAKGETLQFIATGTYTDATTAVITADVTWTSGTLSTATISNAGASEGLATTVAAGTSTITATLGSISGTKLYTVTSEVLVSIVVTPASPSLAKGETAQFTAMGTYTDNSTQDLTTQVTWQSATAGTATISNAGGLEGFLTSAVIGTSIISASLSSISGNTTLTVTAAELVSIAVTTSSASVAKGLTRQFTATGTYTDGTTANLTSTATWGSATPANATINSVGLASGAAIGTSSISATVGAISGNLTLTVTAAELLSIAVTSTNSSITYGAAEQYIATGTYTDGPSVVTGSATWSSTNTGNATINASTGLATSTGIGTTTITATIGAISGSKSLTVAAQAAPPNPSSPAATANSSSQITLSWNAANGSTTSYKIAYQTGSTPANCSTGTTTTAASSDTSKSITGLATSTRYYFRICSLNSNPTPDVSSGVTADEATTSGVTGSFTYLTFDAFVDASGNAAWTYTGLTGAVKIESSQDGGSTWSELADCTNGHVDVSDGSSYIGSFPASAFITIKITSCSSPSVSISDGPYESTCLNPANCP